MRVHSPRRKRQHVLSLARIALRMQDATLDEQLRCVDCLCGLPAAFVPDRASLRYFTTSIVSHILGRDDSCNDFYPEAGRYVRAWKQKWLPMEQEEPQTTPPNEVDHRVSQFLS